ncbi:hypothetical protein CN495_08245 [Bacillus thuringiensis]|uniref:YopX protein domain-containing protein n=1 Tax=Bacillus thuringiensis TaxID=1428 RepID=A0ABD6S7C3_BACTU|nr:hypothetical protein [Bacillus thuringiensis]PER55734.1 hypothetical protein CN495_08245 [Bacillus thuringiensis]
MKDKFGNVIEVGKQIQFDDDYFGHGMTREVKVNEQGILGFEAIPNVSEELCYVDAWLDEIEVVTENTVIRKYAKHVTLDGKPYFY